MSKTMRFLAALVTGVMLSLPWLGFPGWVLFIAWIPLLAIDSYYLSLGDKVKSIHFWAYAFLAFLVWNALTTWWIVHATVMGAILAIVVNSLLMSIVAWLAHLLRRNSTGSVGYIGWVVFWLTFEFFHFHWDIEWPWLTLGNGFANNIKMVQWYEYTGVLGGSLWVLIVNILLFSSLGRILSYQSFRPAIVPLAVVLLFLSVPIFLSHMIYNQIQDNGETRTVLLVQPNIDPYSETFDDGAVNDKLMKFIRLTESGLEDDVDYIIGPETVFEQNWDEEQLETYPAIHQLRLLTEGKVGRALIIGASTYRIYPNGVNKTSTARDSQDGSYSFDRYNTALFTSSTGAVQTYHKSILVSGVEKMPFSRYLGFLEKFIINLGGTTGSLGIQDEPENFKAPNGDLIAPIICYESVFGGYLSKFVQQGAGFITVITNDGWWKNTPGYRQHFAFSRLRAIETRRYVARAANTGISGVIGQRGEIVASTPWWTEAVEKVQLKLNDKLTFYVKYGDFLGRISMFMAGLLVFYLISGTLRKGKKNPH